RKNKNVSDEDVPKDDASAEAESAADGTDAVPTPSSDEDLVALGDKDAIFEALWKRTLEAWDDDKPHNAILDHALRRRSCRTSPDVIARSKTTPRRVLALRRRSTP